MKLTKLCGWLGLLLAPALFAQDRVTTPAVTETKPTRDIVAQPAQPARTELLLQTDKTSTTAQQERQTQATDLVQKFKEEREAFLKQQAEKKEVIKEERKDVRDQLSVKRETFLEAQRQAKEEMQSRIESMKDDLKNHKGVIDAAKEAVRDTRKGGAP